MDRPKYRKIADDLRGRIDRGELPPGSKIPTEAELEQTYGVSRITVSRAVLELQNQDLVYRVKGSGTFILSRGAQGGGAKPSTGMSIISAIFPQGEQNGAHDMLIGIESECAKDGFYVTIHNSRNKPHVERATISNLLAQACGGLIVFPCYATHQNAGIYSELRIRCFPTVFVDRHVDYLDIPLVACDNEGAMRELVGRLIERGHTRIGFFCNSIETVSSEHERFLGYCKALVAARLPVQPSLIFRRYKGLDRSAEIFDVDEVTHKHYADAALDHFLDEPERPTCVVAVNDILAIALMKAAMAKGMKVPGDLAITGFDDLYLSEHVEVPLTTVRQPFEKIGVAAARLLLDRLKRPAQPQADVRLPAEIIFRQSA